MAVTIRQKIKGKGNPWWVFINHRGQRTSRKIGDKAAAEIVASRIRAKLQLGGFGFKEIPTFKQYADNWIKITVPATCRPSTAKDYQDILRIHVLPVFGDSKVTDITRAKIKNFLYGKINEGKARSTVNHYKAVITGVLNEFIDAGIILANPAHRLGKIGKAKDGKEAINPLTRNELDKLLHTARIDFSRHYPLFLLLARTGLRIGEALALKWDDIDFNARSINIERTFSKGRVGAPKSGRSRSVDMSRQLTDTLWKLKEQRVVIPINKDSGWVFTNDKGGLIDSDNWRRRIFNEVLKKAGLRKIRIHDMRHTYATLRLSKGDNVVDVANQLGDNQKVVLDIYSHWMPGKKKDEVDALDDPEYKKEVTWHESK